MLPRNYSFNSNILLILDLQTILIRPATEESSIFIQKYSQTRTLLKIAFEKSSYTIYTKKRRRKIARVS